MAGFMTDAMRLHALTGETAELNELLKRKNSEVYEIRKRIEDVLEDVLKRQRVGEFRIGTVFIDPVYDDEGDVESWCIRRVNEPDSNLMKLLETTYQELHSSDPATAGVMAPFGSPDVAVLDSGD